MKKTLLVGFTMILCFSVKGQFIDAYGIKIGTGLSNQYWKYKNEALTNLSGWNNNKVGIIGQVFFETNIGRLFAIRSTIGYLQKGFEDDRKLIFEGDEEFAIKDNKVVLHDLSLDLSLKITPIGKTFKPYILMGFRGDYLIDYRSVIVKFQGEEHELNTALFDDFNKFTFGAIVGLGILYNDLVFLDIEYNPVISKNHNSSDLAIHDRYFSLTFGLNIGQLIQQN